MGWCLLFLLASDSPAAVPKVRIRVKESLQEVVLQGVDMSRTIHLDSDRKSYPGNRAIKFNCRPKDAGVPHRPVLLASVTSLAGLVSLADESYRGELHVLTSPANNSCDVVNEVSLEEYLAGLLSKEMNASWPLEALKAQAVAARTYAIHMINSNRASRQKGFETHYDLESSEKHQVGGDFFDATPRTSKAARETRGLVLKTDQGHLVPAFFHASCGGRTLLPGQVWSNRVAGYARVNCPRCPQRSQGNWKRTISASRVRNFVRWLADKKWIDIAGMDINREKLRLAPDRPTGQRVRIYLGDRALIFPRSMFRRYFGRLTVPSNHFSLSSDSRGVRLTGKGLGHGVGMCQVGAHKLAQLGRNFKEILAHYYPKHKLVKVY